MRHSFGISEREQWIFKATASELLDAFEKEILPSTSKKIVRGREFVYATGRIPVLLVAHVDTAHRALPGKIFHDQEQHVLWSPNGLGADDRAGVLGIFEVLGQGLQPHVLLTDGEERGCTGAKEAVQALRDPGVLYVVELDRRSGNEAVFYDCANEAFIEYVLGFGFTEAEGTFTDITVLCPAWKVAGVNLSCGYYNAHTTAEYLSLAELWDVIGRVKLMLDALPRKRFKYVPAPKPTPVASTRSTRGTYGSWRNGWSWWDCDYDYGHYSTRSTYSTWNYYDIPVELDISELVAYYGEDELFWELWLDENRFSLAEAAEKAVLRAIDDSVARGLPSVTGKTGKLR